jgi:hypothetical protein
MPDKWSFIQTYAGGDDECLANVGVDVLSAHACAVSKRVILDAGECDALRRGGVCSWACVSCT